MSTGRSKRSREEAELGRVPRQDARAGRRRGRSRRLANARWLGHSWATWRRGALIAGAVAGSGLAVFLSLRHSSDLSNLPWMPRSVAHWADRHGRLRNLPAYFLLAWPSLLLSRTAAQRAWAIAGVGAFGTALEFAEVWVPTRWFDWKDILWSWAGALIAWVLFDSVRWGINRVRPAMPWTRHI